MFINPFKEQFDSFLIKPANSVYDDGFRAKLIDSGFLLKMMTDDYSNLDCTDEYLDFFPKWIESSKNNKIMGLEAFPYRMISLGCTQGLDEFHYWCQLNNKKIRMFRGEYPYNRDCINFDWDNDFIDDHPLKFGDAVIISLPFSGSGNIHSRWSELVTSCNELEIPIFVDAAFFGTCANVELNFDEPCIQFVAFSTTKGLSCGSYRNGILFAKEKQGHLAVQTDWHHGIHLNTSIGLFLMKNFSPDYLYDKYKNSYAEVCEHYGLQASQCIHLALGDEKWSYFDRDGAFNRIGVRNAVKAQFKGKLS